MMERRRFLSATASAFAALTANRAIGRMAQFPDAGAVYGPLVNDPKALLSLPEGFSYRVLSSFGEAMSDGGTVPDKADGMGCFQLSRDELVLVRNHELTPGDDAGGALETGFGTQDSHVLPGGTTHLVIDARTLTVKRQFRSLAGTLRNCAGGTTPWGSWLSCEEAVVGPGHSVWKGLGRDHGWVFEVPASAERLVTPIPLRALGRFNHEAACVDPDTGAVYLTEDRDDSVLYRFLPDVPGTLAAGGRLQAMRVDGHPDARNWQSCSFPVGRALGLSWLDLDDVEAPEDDLRMRAAAAGATLIARGEGIHMGIDELYFCSTSGGARGLGQIFRLALGRGSARDTVELFFESRSPTQFNFGDNLTVAPNGHLIVCEDQYTEVVDNRLMGIAPDGRAYTIGHLLRQTELAGACFSPDGRWLFVNAYSPTCTLAISGPWQHLRSANIET